MAFKFEKLEVWELALLYADLIYEIAKQLPRSEEYNLKGQIVRSVTSIALNIAEGSTSQSDAEQGRFVGMALRSCVETVACLQLIKRRKYIAEGPFEVAYAFAEKLFAKLQAFRRSLRG